MKQLMAIALFASVVLTVGCAKHHDIAHDLSTPEGAILSIEDAYREKNIDKAVACKDFSAEAKDMLTSKSPAIRNDPKIISSLTEVLELAYRKEMTEKGFPDMTNVKSTFPNKKDIGSDQTIVTEVFYYTDGTKQTQDILMQKTGNQWKMVHPVE